MRPGLRHIYRKWLYLIILLFGIVRKEKIMDQSGSQRIGYNLRMLRFSRNVNQKQLADFIGLTRSSYAQYELGNRTPDAHTLNLIAQFYRINMELFFESDVRRFLSEVTYLQMYGDNCHALIETFRHLSPFSKGRLVEYSEKLLEGDRIRQRNIAELENRRKV